MADPAAARREAEDRVHDALDEGTLAVEEYYDAETRGHETESANTRCRLALAHLVSDVRALRAEPQEPHGCPIEGEPGRESCAVCGHTIPNTEPPGPAPDETPSGLTGRRTKWDSSPTATPADTDPGAGVAGSVDRFGRSSGTTTEPLESSTMRPSFSNAGTRSSRGAGSVLAAESATRHPTPDSIAPAPPPDAAVREAAERLMREVGLEHGEDLRGDCRVCAANAALSAALDASRGAAKGGE